MLKPTLLSLLLLIPLFAAEDPPIGGALTVGSGLPISGQTELVLLTEELGVEFKGDPANGARITLGNVVSTITTNVVYGDNTQPTRHTNSVDVDGVVYFLVGVPPLPVTERWWITNVVATHTLTFQWRGTNWSVVDTQLLSSRTNRQVLKEYWKTEEQ